MPPHDSNAPQQPAVKPMGRFRASALIAAESWDVLKQDREMAAFPVMSLAASAAVFAAVAAAYYFIALGGNIEAFEEKSADPIFYVYLLALYVGQYFVVNFFESCVFIIAHARFNGQDKTFRDGLNGALSHSGKIFAWSVISATVGVVLQFISDKSKLAGRLVAGLMGAAWNVLTYFSLLSLVIGNNSIGGSFKESASVIRQKWGETFILHFGVSIFLGAFAIGGVVVGVAAMIALGAYGNAVMIAIGALTALYVVAISVIAALLGSIFKLALYEYARTGVVPRGFTPYVVENAVRTK